GRLLRTGRCIGKNKGFPPRGATPPKEGLQNPATTVLAGNVQGTRDIRGEESRALISGNSTTTARATADLGSRFERQRFTLRCFSQSNISRKREHQLPRKGYLKIPRSHSREDLLVGEIFRSMSTTIRLLPRLGMRIQPPRNQRLVGSSDRMNGTSVISGKTTAKNLYLA